jgi:hypothetical protein
MNFGRVYIPLFPDITGITLFDLFQLKQDGEIWRPIGYLSKHVGPAIKILLDVNVRRQIDNIARSLQVSDD